MSGLFNLPLRQTMGMAQSQLKLAGLEWRVRDSALSAGVGSISRR
jgi:hypothetical protein